MKNAKKRKYEQRVVKNILVNRNFLIERLKKDWAAAEKGAKKEIIVRRAKEGGIFIARSILSLLALGGILTVALTAPNILGAAGKIGGYRQFYNKKDFRRSVTYLKSKGYVTVNKDGKDGYQIGLTAKGLRSTLLDIFKNFNLPKQKWDGHWRVVTFDIPRSHNAIRNLFREKLILLGFYKLHASVFVAPYPCEKELGYIISVLGLAPFVHVIKATEISIEKSLKEHFGL